MFVHNGFQVLGILDKLQMSYSVAIVEDDAGYRGRIASVINADAQLDLVASAVDYAQAVAFLEQGIVPQVMLVDLGLPDRSGLDLIREVQQRGLSTEVMVLTVFADERHVVSAIEAGATGYLLKDETPELIIDSIVQLVRGGSPISPAIARYIIKSMHFRSEGKEVQKQAITSLTPKELEILELIAKGYIAPEIATVLGAAHNTVLSHVKHIYRKLAVHNRTEAIYEAMQQGLISMQTVGA